MHNQLRHSYIEPRILEHNLASRAAHVPQLLSMLKTEPGKLRQRRLVSLAGDYSYMGLFKYALGIDLADCRDCLAKSLDANLEAFQLRGSQEAFPVMDLLINSSKNAVDPDRAQLKTRHPPGTKDYSMTNSRDSFWYTCLGFGIGEEPRGRRMASLIWDPVGADYIGPRSTICTPNQQALAYSLKHYLEEGVETAVATLAPVRTPPDDYIGQQAQMLRSLIQRDVDAFCRALRALLDLHETLSRQDSWDPRLYICVPALGLSALAVTSALIAKNQLPASLYLPIALFAGR